MAYSLDTKIVLPIGVLLLIIYIQNLPTRLILLTILLTMLTVPDI